MMEMVTVLLVISLLQSQSVTKTFAEIISLKLRIDLPSIIALMHHVTVMCMTLKYGMKYNE